MRENLVVRPVGALAFTVILVVLVGTGWHELSRYAARRRAIEAIERAHGVVEWESSRPSIVFVGSRVDDALLEHVTVLPEVVRVAFVDSTITGRLSRLRALPILRSVSVIDTELDGKRFGELLECRSIHYLELCGSQLTMADFEQLEGQYREFQIMHVEHGPGEFDLKELAWARRKLYDHVRFYAADCDELRRSWKAAPWQ